MPKARRTVLRYQHQPTPGKANTRGHNQSLNHHLTRRPKADKGHAPHVKTTSLLRPDSNEEDDHPRPGNSLRQHDQDNRDKHHSS